MHKNKAKLEDLQRQIDAIHAEQRNCRHDFGKPFSDPYTVREPYGYKFRAQGSDTWSEPEGYHDVSKPRWTRVCTKCGFEQHTEKTEPVISSHEPKF